MLLFIAFNWRNVWLEFTLYTLLKQVLCSCWALSWLWLHMTSVLENAELLIWTCYRFDRLTEVQGCLPCQISKVKSCSTHMHKQRCQLLLFSCRICYFCLLALEIFSWTRIKYSEQKCQFSEGGMCVGHERQLFISSSSYCMLYCWLLSRWTLTCGYRSLRLVANRCFKKNSNSVSSFSSDLLISNPVLIAEPPLPRKCKFTSEQLKAATTVLFDVST